MLTVRSITPENALLRRIGFRLLPRSRNGDSFEDFLEVRSPTPYRDWYIHGRQHDAGPPDLPLQHNGDP